MSRAIIIAMLMVFVALVSPSQARDFESSWVVVESGTSEDLLTAVDFENQVWAFGTGGVMLNSSDNGVTWESVESPTNYDIHHSDSGFGSLVVADDSGLFLLKQNLESEWLDISLPEVSQVNGISLIGDQSVVAVGDGGTIFRYSEGVWESFSLTIEVDLMAVSFYDDKSGVIVGSSGTILLSDDGGLTWDYREAPEGAGDAEIIAVEYYSISRIYAITGDGRILMSANNVAQGIEVGYIWALIDFERHYPPGSDEPLLDPSDLDVGLTSVQVVTTTKLMMTGAGG
ncbi:MAG: WD40/YVTN/BNR-like repeat-containing protein, partial [Candidatus Thalassarchaeum sp.]